MSVWIAPSGTLEVILAMADRSSGYAADIASRRAATARCWLCSASLHISQLVPDGTDACTDIRWYCADVPGCTERWIALHHAAPRAPNVLAS